MKKKHFKKQNYKKIKEPNKGITLIALIITIILLLILAGITIQAITNTGIFGKVQQAIEQSKYAKAEEKVKLAVMASYGTNGELNDNQLKENINKINGLEEEITEVTLTYPLTVKVDGYEFLISKLGKVTCVGKKDGTPVLPEEPEIPEEPGLPENTSDTVAGTEVVLKDGWGTETMRYIKTSDGTEVEGLEKVATVYAISDGQENTIPVPYGFWYVGGTLSTGVVISDDERDKNKYAGIADVPSGAIYNSTDGTVKTYTDEEYDKLPADEKKAVILGNQFVWIPVTAEEYVKKDWGKSSVIWETQTNTAELPQIEKYGGFYIGRYEAGTSNITLSTGINFASQNTASSMVNDNFSIRDGLSHTVTGKITSKAGEIPYYHADYYTALKLSNSMYQTNYVQSGLVTGTMWDVMMKFIAGNDDTIVTSSSWGNYTDGSVTYTAGKGRYATVNSSSGAMTSAFTKCDGKYYYGIKTTAISEDVKKKNLYDVAGNLWEWTQEAAYSTNGVESYIIRGGSYRVSSGERPTCYRACDDVRKTYTFHGFRITLYIK